jgi:sugar phosphate isomerase/epimerase
MKLTFSTLACPAWSLTQILDAAVGFGYAGVDFRGIGAQIDVTLLPEFTTDLSSTKSMLLERRLSVPCLCSSIWLNAPEADKWNRMLEEFVRTVSLARELGTETIRIFPGATPGSMSREDCITQARRRARQLAKLAAGSGVVPVLETHDDWQTGAAAPLLIDDCAPAEFGILWDIRHSVVAGESLEDSVRLFGPRLRHVHIKDARNTTAGEVSTLIGEGEMPIRRAVELLRSEGYAGWYCLENEKRWRPAAPEPELILPNYVQFMRGI